MAKLGTLKTIIDDIMLILRQNNISESEQISEIQIESWIHQYRSMLIKQDIDKNRDINPDYIQEITAIPLDIVDRHGSSEFEGGDKILVTSIDIPKSIDFHFKSGIVSVSDLFGNEIQLMGEKRSNMQKYRKYTFYNYSAFRKGDRIYINGPGDIQAVNIRGIFENPTDISSYDIENDIYPIPSNMIPVLKELIFSKEFKLNLITDKENNSTDDTQNITLKR